MDVTTTEARQRVLTIPNALSALRLAGVPLFLWLLLGPQYDGLAVLVLVLSGITDWLDGKLARVLGQYSRIGELLDPVADRLYTLSTLLAFAIRDIVPWWFVALLVGRDVVLAITLPVLRRCGHGPLEVHYLGKAATLCLLYAFPLLLLAVGADGLLRAVVLPLALAFTIWGTWLYLWSALLYLARTVSVVRRYRAG